MSDIVSRRPIPWLAAALLAAILSAPARSPAQALYEVTGLGAAGVFPAAINDDGGVVGSYSPAAGAGPLAFVWRDGTLTGLGKLARGTYSQATAINAAGVIAGDGDTGDYRPQAWVTTRSGLSIFFRNNGGNTHALFVGDGGWIGGYYTKSLSGNTASWRGAIWAADPKDPRKYRTTDLPAIPGRDSKYTSAIPWAFNRSGQAAGWAVNDVIGQHAAFWNNDAAHSVVDLGVFPGDWSSIARGMNNLGEVVGESHPPFGSRPVAWHAGAAHTPMELPLLPGDNYGTATAINDLGHVLGSSAASEPGTWNVGPGRPVIWRDGGVFELRSLLDGASGAGWTILSATALNNRGQIVGTGLHHGQPRAFLLTPLP
jgi:probable HAF family extracellular repeat protein